MSNSLTSKTINGVKWTTGSTVVNSVIQLGYSAVMAHLLTPADFGIVAAGNVALRFGGYFAQMGLGQTLIQKKELFEEDIRAAFTSSVLLGAIFMVVVWLSSPFIAYLLKVDALTDVLKLMGVSFVINGISSTSVSLFRRNIQFKELAIIEVVSFIIGYIGVGIGLAYYGYGVWSLVYASLSQVLTLALLTYALQRHSVLFLFAWKFYKPLFSYGGRISVISFTEFLGESLDTMVISRVLGPTQLGYYNRGQMLVNLPTYFIITSLSKVLFPSFSRIQSDLNKLKQVYLSSITLIASLIIPMGVGIIVAAHEIVWVMLSKKWTASIPILQILAIAVPLSFITMFAGIVCDATANLRHKIIVTTSYVFILAGLFYVLKDLGIVGFAISLAICQVIRTLMYMVLMNKILHASYIEILNCYIPGIINSIVVGLGIYLITVLLTYCAVFPLIILIFQVIAGGLLLSIVVLLLPSKILKREIQGFLNRINITEGQNGVYNRLMLSYINYLNKKS